MLIQTRLPLPLTQLFFQHPSQAQCPQGEVLGRVVISRQRAQVLSMIAVLDLLNVNAHDLLHMMHAMHTISWI